MQKVWNVFCYFGTFLAWKVAVLLIRSNFKFVAIFLVMIHSKANGEYTENFGEKYE